MPLRSLGYALDEATLKQVAYNHGITESLTNMSQAQKSQIRYLAIMEQSKNALGDMARTIESPANQLRIFSQRVDQLKRAIGNGLMPIISAALPYVTALVRMLTEGAQKIADFLGFEIPVFDYGDLIAAQNADISSSFDEATSAAKEFQGSLSSIDQLNIIGDKANSSAADGLGSLYDLNIDLPSYDFLGGLSEQADDAYNTLKNFWNKAKPYLEAIGAGFATMFVTSKISGLVGSLKKISTVTPFLGKFAAGLTGGVTALVLFKDSVKKLMTGQDGIVQLGIAIGGTVAAIGAFVAFGNPVGAVITAVGALTGVIWGVVEAQKEMNREIADTIMYAENGGISVEGLADGFSAYFSEISTHYDDILENTKAFKENREKIQKAADKVYYLTDKYTILGETMSAESAQTLADNLDTIKKAVEDSLGTATQDIVINLQTTFSEALEKMGADVDGMVSKFYILESMGNSSLAQIKQQADEIVSKVIGGEYTSEDLQQLEELTRKMSAANVGTVETKSFEQALKEMSTAQIDFTSPTDVTNAIEKVQSAADAATESVKTAFAEQSLEFEQLKQQYISMGVDVEFDVKFGTGTFDTLFSDLNKAMELSYKAEEERINSAMGVFGAMMYSQYEKNIEEAILSTEYTLGDYIGANWEKTVIGAISPFTWGETLNPQKNYQDMKEQHEQTIRDQFSDITNALDEALAGINISQYNEVGAYLVEGMANGALSEGDNFNKALDLIATNSIDELKELLGIHSPSTVFTGLGGYMMKGLANGITDGQRYALRAIDETARAMQRQMSDFYFEVPEYTSEDFEKIMLGDFSIAPSSLPTPPTTESYDERTVSEMASIFAAAKQNGEPIVLHNYTTVELDGQVLGEAQSTYQNDQMVYSNGVTR